LLPLICHCGSSEEAFAGVAPSTTVQTNRLTKRNVTARVFYISFASFARLYLIALRNVTRTSKRFDGSRRFTIL
jgi:hypothetical protein